MMLFIVAETFIVNIISKKEYYETYKKILTKNDIIIDKYHNIVNNLKSSLIMINTTKYTLQVNIAFINLIKKLKIYDEDLEKIMTKTITDYELLEVNYTKITQEDEFVTFIDDFLIYETLENLDNDKYSQKKRRKIFRNHPTTRRYFCEI